MFKKAETNKEKIKGIFFMLMEIGLMKVGLITIKTSSRLLREQEIKEEKEKAQLRLEVLLLAQRHRMLADMLVREWGKSHAE